MMPYAWYWQQKYQVNNTSFGQTRFKLKIRPVEYYKVGGFFLVSVLALWLLMMIIMMVLVAIFQDLANPNSLQVLNTVVTILNWILRILVMYPLYGFISVSLLHLRLHHSRLGDRSLYSRISPYDYTVLLFKNAFMSLVTLGFYMPRARIRINQYLLGNISVFASGGLDSFVAAKDQEVSALGDGAADLWDFEIGI